MIVILCESLSQLTTPTGGWGKQALEEKLHIKKKTKKTPDNVGAIWASILDIPECWGRVDCNFTTYL